METRVHPAAERPATTAATERVGPQHRLGAAYKEPGSSSPASLLCPLLGMLGTALARGGQEGPGTLDFHL